MTAPVESEQQYTDEPTVGAFFDGEDFTSAAEADNGGLNGDGVRQAAGLATGGAFAGGAIRQKTAMADYELGGAKRDVREAKTVAEGISKYRMDDAYKTGGTADHMTKPEQKTIDNIRDGEQRKADGSTSRGDSSKSSKNRGLLRKGSDLARNHKSNKLDKAASNAGKTIARSARNIGWRKAAGAAAQNFGRFAARSLAMAVIPGPGWAMAAAGIIGGFALAGIGSWLGSKFKASGPSTDSPPTDGMKWLPIRDKDDQ